MDESEKIVYYLQYAHARISNLGKRFKKEVGETNKINLQLLDKEDEMSLMKKLSQFPKKMEQLHESLEPSATCNLSWKSKQHNIINFMEITKLLI